MTTTAADTLVPDQLWQAIQPAAAHRRPATAVDGSMTVPRHHLPAPHRRPLAAAAHRSARLRQPDHLLAAARLAARRVWQRLRHMLLDQLGRDGRIDWSRASVDALSVRAKQSTLTGPNPTDRGKPGSSTTWWSTGAAFRWPPACQRPTSTTRCCWGRWSTRAAGQGPTGPPWAAAPSAGQAARRQGGAPRGAV